MKKFEGIYGTLDHVVVEAESREEARKMLPEYIESPILGALHVIREITDGGDAE